MTQKKTTKDWVLGLYHFFLTGILGPQLFALLFVVIGIFVFNADKPSSAAFTFITPPLVILGYLVGNSMFLKSNYIIRKNNAILNYSTIFYIFYMIYRATPLVSQGISIDMGINIGIAVLEILLYYIISKKYIAKIISE